MSDEYATFDILLERMTDSLETVPGVKKVYTYAPDSLGEFPCLVLLPFRGYAEESSIGQKECGHDLQVQLHLKAKDTAETIKGVVSFIESITNTLLKQRDYDGLITGFDRISYTFGEIGYGTDRTYGYIFTIEGIKFHTPIE